MNDLTPERLVESWQTVPHSDPTTGIRVDTFAHTGRLGCALWCTTTYSLGKDILPLGIAFDHIKIYLG